MTRAGALAMLASGALASRALLEYTPGEVLVVDHLLGGGERACARADDTEPKHVFDAAPFMRDDGGSAKAWGYAVDPRA